MSGEFRERCPCPYGKSGHGRTKTLLETITHMKEHEACGCGPGLPHVNNKLLNADAVGVHFNALVRTYKPDV